MLLIHDAVVLCKTVPLDGKGRLRPFMVKKKKVSPDGELHAKEGVL